MKTVTVITAVSTNGWRSARWHKGEGEHHGIRFAPHDLSHVQHFSLEGFCASSAARCSCAIPAGGEWFRHWNPRANAVTVFAVEDCQQAAMLPIGTK
ncbi:hypothetical protein [Caballeronia grimmiae]|uniref:hypothetical protein n=1 Tax=Caballeronia grimmiae TaxID=1071679 RepID=UPI0038B7343D